jgi:hypothetical protein
VTNVTPKTLIHNAARDDRDEPGVTMVVPAGIDSLP